MKSCSKCGVEFEKSSNGSGTYCKQCRNDYSRQYYKNLKLEAFAHYGGPVCKCCGVTEVCFLSLDHENNDGYLNRLDGGNLFYRWLKKNNWPDIGLRVLCHNCNHGRFINGGICPHQVFARVAEQADAVVSKTTGQP